MKNHYKKVSSPKKNIQIFGFALASTIEQTSVLGKVGKAVLKSQGITDIVGTDRYSATIRSEIHKEIFRRFGEYPLSYFGFLQVEGFKGDFLILREQVEKFYEGNKEKIHSQEYAERLVWLSRFVDQIAQITNKMLLKATRDNFFGLVYEKLDDTCWEYQYTHPSIITYEEPYNRGSMTHYYIKYLLPSWDLRVEIDKHKSLEGIGWSRYVWRIQFLRKNEGLDRVNARLSEYKQKARDKLFRCVIEDADAQKEKVEALLEQLGKYTPPQIQASLLRGDYTKEIATKRKKLTIFFSDIANFTSTSEGLQPEDLTKYLNQYFSQMTAIAIDCGATIDKYIGDAMMVFFGDPETNGEREDARSCVEMALKMQEKIRELQEEWSSEGFANPFQVRMGINTGYCNVGNFGSDQRLTYTIIGGEVNVAQRLEASSNPNGILMSYETYAFAQDMIEVEELEAIKMKGVSREIKVFSVVQRKNKTRVKNNRRDIQSTKKDLSEIEKLKKEMFLMKNNIRDINKNIEKILKKLSSFRLTGT
mgnify:CR=1 FL=1